MLEPNPFKSNKVPRYPQWLNDMIPKILTGLSIDECLKECLKHDLEKIDLHVTEVLSHYVPSFKKRKTRDSFAYLHRLNHVEREDDTLLINMILGKIQWLINENQIDDESPIVNSAMRVAMQFSGIWDTAGFNQMMQKCGHTIGYIPLELLNPYDSKEITATQSVQFVISVLLVFFNETLLERFLNDLVKKETETIFDIEKIWILNSELFLNMYSLPISRLVKGFNHAFIKESWQDKNKPLEAKSYQPYTELTLT